MNPPSRLYKYRPLNERTISTIVNSVIRFSTADDFNDPFDCRCRYNYEGTDAEWRKALERLLRNTSAHLTNEEIESTVAAKIDAGFHRDQDALDRYWEASQSEQRAKNGILCLTACPKNILMWSHYADAHKGCCLEFSTSGPPFSRALEVDYPHEYPNNRLVDFIGGSSDEVYAEHAKLVTYTKSALWKYEQEWRVRNFPQGQGLFKFEERLLTGVIFGHWMPSEHKGLLEKLVSGRNPKVTLFQASPKGRQFEMELLPLN